MPDVGPDEKALQSLRLQRQRKQIELNMFDCELRLAELDQEKKRLQLNIKESHVALEQLDEDIAGVDNEELTDG